MVSVGRGDGPVTRLFTAGFLTEGLSGYTMHEDQLKSMTPQSFLDLVERIQRNLSHWRRQFIALMPEMARREIWRDTEFEGLGHYASVHAGISVPMTARILKTYERIRPYPELRGLWHSATYGWTKFEIVAKVVDRHNCDGFVDSITAGVSVSALKLMVEEKLGERLTAAAHRAGLDLANVDQEHFGARDSTESSAQACVECRSTGTDSSATVASDASLETLRPYDGKGRPLVPLNVRPQIRERLRRTFAALRADDPTVPNDDSGMVQWLLDHARSDAFQQHRYIEVVTTEAETGRKTIRTEQGTFAVDDDEMKDSLKDGPAIYLAEARAEAEMHQRSYEEDRRQAGLPPNDYITKEARRYIDLRSGGGYCEFPGCNARGKCRHHLDPQMLYDGHRVDRIHDICRGHHELYHLGLVDGVDGPIQQHRLRSQRKLDTPIERDRARVDHYYELNRKRARSSGNQENFVPDPVPANGSKDT